jgi:hypothetical protein
MVSRRLTMIEYPLQIACQVLHCEKHQLKYWQLHLDPKHDRHGYTFRVLLIFRLIQFLIDECYYTVNSLKKSHFDTVFETLESIADESTLLQQCLSFNYRTGLFVLGVFEPAQINKFQIDQFTLINIKHLYEDVEHAFKE